MVSAVGWLLVKVIVFGLGAYMLKEPVSSYDQLAARSRTREPLDRFFPAGKDDSYKQRTVTALGVTLQGLAALLAFKHERAARRAAEREHTESLYWLGELREAGGPKIGRILREQGLARALELQDFQDLMLTLGLRRWQSRLRPASIRLAYYRRADRSSEGYRLSLERKLPADWDIPNDVRYPAPILFDAKRRVRRWHRQQWQLEFLRRRSVFQVPVVSPVVVGAEPLGVVFGISEARRKFGKGESRVSAEFLAAWLGAGEVAAAGSGSVA